MDYKEAAINAAEDNITEEVVAAYIAKNGFIEEEPHEDEFVCAKCLSDCEVCISYEEQTYDYEGHFEATSDCCGGDYYTKDHIYDQQIKNVDFPIPTAIETYAAENFAENIGNEKFVYYVRDEGSLPRLVTNSESFDGFFSVDDYDKIDWRKVYCVITKSANMFDCVQAYAERWENDLDN